MNQMNLSTNEILAQATPCPVAKPQVYFLIDGDEIVYVGSSTNFYNRLAAHYYGGKVFTHFSVIDCTLEQLEIVEYNYIRALKPKYNIQTEPNGDWKPIDKVKKPSGVYRKQFVKFIESLDLPKNELGFIQQSLVREKWIEHNGSWCITSNYPLVTKDSDFYDEFIKKGKINDKHRLNPYRDSYGVIGQ